MRNRTRFSIPRFLSRDFQSSQRSCAVAEPIGFDAEAPQHAEIEIAQGRRILWIEMQMLAMPETAARQQYRQIANGVTAAVAKIAAEIDHGAIEQSRAFLARL